MSEVNVLRPSRGRRWRTDRPAQDWELRKRAEKALGPKFNVAEFHDEVLKDGAVPLEVLEAKIDRWIAAKRGG